jgi:hypothetical protein
MARVRTIIAALITGLGFTPEFVSAWVQGASQCRASRTWERSVGTKPDSTEPWYGEYPPAGVEPPLAEVLADPIVHLLMRADHLIPGKVLPCGNRRRAARSQGSLT